METALVLLGAGALVFFTWSSHLRARELALAACAAACRREGAQLLDQTVLLHRLALRRGAGGWPVLSRSYAFEFSVDGLQRYPGRVVLLGGAVEYVQMSYPQGALIVHP